MKSEFYQPVGNKTNGVAPNTSDEVELKKADFEKISTENQRLLAEILELQYTNKEYKSVIYHISHDLNWPLNNIISLINLMMDTQDPEEMVTLSKPVLKSINNFKASMNEILKLNGREDKPDIKGQVTIKTVLTEVLESINGQFLDSGAVLSRSFQVSHLNFPKKKLRSILFNLISNAIKYKSPERISKIHVSSYRKGDYVVLSVMDNGKGIQPQKMDQLFTKFGTLHDRSHTGESLGIGLFLIKKLVEEAGGKIEAESEWDKGSVFNVYLRQESSLPN
ncbi:sensor histidine kinase [Cyclobacterium jeungdonense]|uniref:histidine kinase n=1 Tax=Cyclobacterium jeungdonense TaxID=708087 RepID=A0ABT8CEE1_9BACT|nr:HAMP domain-containing sensor histidine kinase [Cyclobacterium jeungdonense]MDN3690061.1 HAMP domain-containing sensor histidine kinase [Cyclobacterium jeungdonense]